MYIFHKPRKQKVCQVQTEPKSQPSVRFVVRWPAGLHAVHPLFPSVLGRRWNSIRDDKISGWLKRNWLAALPPTAGPGIRWLSAICVLYRGDIAPANLPSRPLAKSDVSCWWGVYLIWSQRRWLADLPLLDPSCWGCDFGTVSFFWHACRLLTADTLFNLFWDGGEERDGERGDAWLTIQPNAPLGTEI